MKKFSFALLFLFLALPLFSQKGNPSTDEEAIRNLIQTEIRAFIDKDWKLFESCWLQEPYTRHFVTSRNAFNGRIGWENMKSIMSQSFETEGPRGFTSEKTDIDINVFGDAAYATFLEHHWSTQEENPWEIQAINNAFFVKRDGEWKFVCMNIVNTSSFETARENRALVEEFLETISGEQKTQEMFLRFFAEDKQDLLEQNLMVEQAFPLYELAPEEILQDGNRVVVRAEFTGIQHGTFGSIPPTGNQVQLPVVLFFTVDQGKISEYEVIYDRARMLRQLDALY